MDRSPDSARSDVQLGPKSSGLIAFAEKGGGKLVIMDRTGKKQKIEGTKGVVLPAWTEDGAQMAYLETRGKNKLRRDHR